MHEMHISTEDLITLTRAHALIKRICDGERFEPEPEDLSTLATTQALIRNICEAGVDGLKQLHPAHYEKVKADPELRRRYIPGETS